MIYQYKAFNQTIISALSFPELLVDIEANTTNAIQVSIGEVSKKGLINPIKSGAFFQTDQQHYWLHVPQIARFLVSNGQHIVVDPYPQVDEASLRVIILESCFKAILCQQNLAVLEGCAVKIGEYAVLFVMPTGFGKSTLSSLFLKKGYCLLSEEICAIRQDGQLLPSYPAINLWSNISKQLDIAMSTLKTIRPSVEKYRLTVDNNHFHAEPLAIQLIYTVNYHKSDTLVIADIVSDAKLTLLKSGAFTPSFLVENELVIHDTLSGLSHYTPFINLTCPRWNYTMNQLGDLLSGEFNAIETDILQRVATHGK